MAVLRKRATVVEPLPCCSWWDQCCFRCPDSWRSSYLSGAAALILTFALRLSVYLSFQLSAHQVFFVLIYSYLFFPPLLPSAQSLLRCHPAGIGRHTALNIPESVSEEARCLLEQVRVSCSALNLCNSGLAVWGLVCGGIFGVFIHCCI